MIHRPFARHEAGSFPAPTSRLGSKTPAPKKLPNSLTSKTAVCQTTGLKQRTFNVYPDENAKANTQDITPQRLFKDAIKSPHTSRIISRYQLLADKTNTVKKPKIFAYAGGVTQKPTKLGMSQRTSAVETVFPVPATPHLVKGRANSPNRSHGSARMLYRTPVTSKRARRPPAAVELSPEPDECEDAETSYASLQINVEPGQLPEVEYGPPTACWEAGEAVEEFDWDALVSHPRFPTSASIDSTEEILLEDGAKSQWQPEPAHPFPDYILEPEDMFDLALARPRVPSLQSVGTVNSSTRSLKSRPVTVTSMNRSRSVLVPRSRPTILSKSTFAPPNPRSASVSKKSSLKQSSQPIPAWAALYNQILNDQRFDDVESPVADLATIDGMQVLQSFVDNFLLPI